VNLHYIFIREFFADVEHKSQVGSMVQFVPGGKALAPEDTRANGTNLGCRFTVAFQFAGKKPCLFHIFSLLQKAQLLSSKEFDGGGIVTRIGRMKRINTDFFDFTTENTENTEL
jgi:hypothetical protein